MNRTYHPRGALINGARPAQHTLYATWSNMLSRCNNRESVSYPNYGERGIVVCDRWRHFRHFVADMPAKLTPELTIERLNNGGNYEPGNCAWGTRTEQSWNRRLFGNNTTGARGVVKVGTRYLARFDYELTRHEIGRFDSVIDAAVAREAFLDWFFVDRRAAVASLATPTLWCTSTTKVRGVTPYVDGGFMARATVNGQRKYLGLFATVDAARAAVAGAHHVD